MATKHVEEPEAYDPHPPPLAPTPPAGILVREGGVVLWLRAASLDAWQDVEGPGRVRLFFRNGQVKVVDVDAANHDKIAAALV